MYGEVTIEGYLEQMNLPDGKYPEGKATLVCENGVTMDVFVKAVHVTTMSDSAAYWSDGVSPKKEIPYPSFAHQYFNETPKVNGSDTVKILKEAFPGIEGLWAQCPACFIFVPESKKLTDVVIELNDKHKWSREKIASWLEESDGLNIPMADPKDAPNLPASGDYEQKIVTALTEGFAIPPELIAGYYENKEK